MKALFKKEKLHCHNQVALMERVIMELINPSYYSSQLDY